MSQTSYLFGKFRFDAKNYVLYYEDEIVERVEKKSLEVLSVILNNPDRIATYDEIVNAVWPNDFGADSMRINGYVSKLQKIFTRYEPDGEFFKNIRGTGYRFLPNISEVGTESLTAERPDDDITTADDAVVDTLPPRSRSRRMFVLGLIGILLLAGGIVAMYRFRPDDETEIRRAVQQSQAFESLVLYQRPASVSERDLDKYWTADKGVDKNIDRIRIWNGVQKLINEGSHYGPETKCSQFEFQKVDIAADHNRAIVKTLETWFIAKYLNDGSLQKNRTVGPYFVSYILEKVDGRWLIAKSSTARVDRPTPNLSDVSFAAPPMAGKEFTIDLFGSDLEKETIYIEVIGPGCPEGRCRVPNSVLLERANISETSIKGIPLTVSSGTFHIIAHNGDSKPSEPVEIIVP